MDWEIYSPVLTLTMHIRLEAAIGVLWLNAIRRKLNSSTYVPESTVGSSATTHKEAPRRPSRRPESSIYGMIFRVC